MNIYNFNEINAQLRCFKGMDVIILKDVKELYSLSLKNCKLVTVIKTIGYINVKKIPLVIIIPSVIYIKS
jgi:hypothetical protein